MMILSSFHFLCQALLDEWRAELARKPMSMSEAEACRVLEYTPGEDGLQEEGLKAAYRTMARRSGWLCRLLRLRVWPPALGGCSK